MSLHIWGNFIRFSYRQFFKRFHEYRISLELYNGDQKTFLPVSGFCAFIMADIEPISTGTIAIIVVYSIQTRAEVNAY